MAKDSPAQFLDRIMVRLPDGMRAKIMQQAARNGRSMNAEVVARLDASFGTVTQPFTPEQEKLVMGWLDASMAEVKAETERRLREVEEKAGLR